jgi:hypothetical protein
MSACYTTRIVVPLVLAAAFLCVGSRHTTAQVRDSISAAEWVEEASRKSWFIRVTYLDSSTVAGRARNLGGNDVRLGDRRIVIDSISSIHRRIHDKAGARAGLIIGAIGGVVLGGRLGAMASDPDSGGPMSTWQVYISLVGSAGFGALIGMLVADLVTEKTWVPLTE